MSTEYKKIQHYVGNASNLSSEIRDKMLSFNSDTKRLQFAETKALGWTVIPNWNDLATKENILGNPSSNGLFLTSNTSGVRSWVNLNDGMSNAITIPDNGGAGVGKWAKLGTITMPNGWTYISGVTTINHGYNGLGAISIYWKVTSIGSNAGIPSYTARVIGNAGLDPALFRVVRTKNWPTDSANEAELWYQSPSSNTSTSITHTGVYRNNGTVTWTPELVPTWVISTSTGSYGSASYDLIANTANLTSLTAARIVATDANKNLVSWDVATARAALFENVVFRFSASAGYSKLATVRLTGAGDTVAVNVAVYGVLDDTRSGDFRIGMRVRQSASMASPVNTPLVTVERGDNPLGNWYFGYTIDVDSASEKVVTLWALHNSQYAYMYGSVNSSDFAKTTVHTSQIPTGTAPTGYVEASLASRQIGELRAGAMNASSLNLLNSSAGADVITCSYSGSDVVKRFRISAAGYIEWGDGTTTRDVNLYRESVNILRTDDTFTASSFRTTDGVTRISASGAGSLTTLSTSGLATLNSALVSSLTASRALVSDANKNLVSSSVTSTELGYLSGATSNIQNQINALSIPSYAILKSVNLPSNWVTGDFLNGTSSTVLSFAIPSTVWKKDSGSWATTSGGSAYKYKYTLKVRFRNSYAYAATYNMTLKFNTTTVVSTTCAAAGEGILLGVDFFPTGVNICQGQGQVTNGSGTKTIPQVNMDMYAANDLTVSVVGYGSNNTGELKMTGYELVESLLTI